MLTVSGTHRPLYEDTIDKLEKLLSIPLDSLVFNMLHLEHYSGLLAFLPWDNRFQGSMLMPTAVQASGKVLPDVRHIE